MLLSAIATTLFSASFALATIQILPIGFNGSDCWGEIDILVRVNDTVVFTFLSGNHSLTQSSFETPCEPLAGGFDSGWVDIPANVSANIDNSPTLALAPPTFALNITNNEPIFFYCHSGTNLRCNDGTVGALNRDVAKDEPPFHSFLSNAASATTIGQTQARLSGVGALATGFPIANAPGEIVYHGSAVGLRVTFGAVFAGLVAVMFFL